MEWIEEANQEDEHLNETLSFDEYFDIFKKYPERECRPSHKYLIDMLHYFKNLFQTYHADAPPVFGQNGPQKSLFQNLKNFQEEGINNKFILLVGPNGSSKSSLVKKLIKGAEEYSKIHEGALYTFSWIFPREKYIKGGGLGLNPSSQRPTHINSYAKLDDKEINAILNSELRDHPILLIPKNYRQKLIEDKLHSHPDLLTAIKKSYLYQGDLSKRNKMIYEALLKNYKGDHHEILKHIRVERFTISKRYSIGAATIEPQMHVDAQMHQMTMDKRLASLPPGLQSLNLFSLQGEIIMANRGILEYSDLLKRPLETYKYLLTTTESGSINLRGILTELDILFIGTSNEIHLAAFHQHPDYNSFKARLNFIRVPYLLDYKKEEMIYNEQIKGLKNKSIFGPHSLTLLCMFAVMTRLRVCQEKNYSNKKLANIVVTLNPLEKCLFFSENDPPNRLTMENKQILKQSINEVRQEFENEHLYEGKFGISPRDIKNIIYEMTSQYKNITTIDVIDFLEKLGQKKNDYDFLNMTSQGDFHNPEKIIALIREYALNLFDKELRGSLGLVDNRSYENYIKRYIENINALIKGERIKNAITGQFEECDQYFIKEFENNISLQEDPHSFRSHLISKLGAYYLDNPKKRITYSNVFPNLINNLQESFRQEQKKVIKNISKNIVFFESEREEQDNGKHKKEIQSVINNLVEQYGYSFDGALTLFKHIVKEKY